MRHTNIPNFSFWKWCGLFFIFLPIFTICKMLDPSPCVGCGWRLRSCPWRRWTTALVCGAGSPKLSCLTRVALLGLEVWALGAFTILENSFSLKVFPCVMLFVLLRNATCPKAELRGCQPDTSSVRLWNAVSFKSQMIFVEVQHYLNKWLKSWELHSLQRCS